MIRLLVRGAIRAYGIVAPASATAWFARQLMRPRPVAQLDLAPPAAEAIRRSVPFVDGRLAVTEWGDGPAVLLVHGWGGRSKSFWRLVDPLVASGLRPVAVDLPAHGDSDGRYTTMPECADAVIATAQAIGPVHAAIAHSFGGPATALAMRRGLEVGRLVMVGPPLSVHRALARIADDAGLPDRLFERISIGFAERFRFDWAEFDTDWMAARLEPPLLVVHDEEDRVTPWTHGAAVANAARLGRLFTTAGLGHRAVLADERVVQEVVRFVTEGNPATPLRGADLSGL